MTTTLPPRAPRRIICYVVLVYSQKTATFLERVIQQNDQDLETSYRAMDEDKAKLAEAITAHALMEADLKATRN